MEEGWGWGWGYGVRVRGRVGVRVHPTLRDGHGESEADGAAQAAWLGLGSANLG